MPRLRRYLFFFLLKKRSIAVLTCAIAKKNTKITKITKIQKFRIVLLYFFHNCRTIYLYMVFITKILKSSLVEWRIGYYFFLSNFQLKYNHGHNVFDVWQKFSFDHKLVNEVCILVINMVYASCLTSYQTP